MKKKVPASVITIGQEILYGHILDTNANFISETLTDIGIKVVLHLSVGDDFEDILDALRIAESKSDLILITGGLGPTNDDITKKSLAAYFNVGMKRNQEVYEALSDYFTKRGFVFSESNQRQAELPANAEVIQNDMGTAPGMWFRKGDKVFISMPGVPHEMRFLMTEKIVPRLGGMYDADVIFHKIIMTAGIGESWLSEKIAPWENALPEGLSLAYLPSYGQVRLRITAVGHDRDLLMEKVNRCKEDLRQYIGGYMYGEDGEPIQEAIGKILKARDQTFSLAESCTGGYVAHLVTSIPGSSDYFKGGIVAYSNAIKIRELKVSKATLDRFGAVSEETVREMAQGMRKSFGTDYAIGISGIAGPGGGSEDKPVGTVWIAVADREGELCRKYTILKDRISNIKYASVASLVMLWQRLSRKN